VQVVNPTTIRIKVAEEFQRVDRRLLRLEARTIG